jgi:hypothetical protein
MLVIVSSSAEKNQQWLLNFPLHHIFVGERARVRRYNNNPDPHPCPLPQAGEGANYFR